jgi:CheY-like chemotaxis protein
MKLNELIKETIWPIAFVIVAIFAITRGTGLSQLKELELTENGLRLSYLLTAAEGKQDDKNASKLNDSDRQQIIETAFNTQNLSLNGRKILWVDDTPANNSYEIDAFNTLGISVTQVKSTSEALIEFPNENYDVVISDFRRDADPDDEYGLLLKLQNMKSQVKYIIYSASVTAEYEQEAIEKGAFGETNRPRQLFELVINALQQNQ